MAKADHERMPALEGSCNFRDLGGYEAQDGRRLAWRRIYRSGVLAYCAQPAPATLSALGIRLICDLRRAKERSRELTRWPDPSVEHLHWDDPMDSSPLRDWRHNYPDTADGTRQAMLNFYRQLPFWLALRLRGLFSRLAQGAVPAVIHCAAGKDRTGVTVAILLSALGIPRDVVLADYLLTNDAVNLEKWFATRRGGNLGLGDGQSHLLRMTPGGRRALFAADADYLQASLEEIDRRCGSLEGYLQTVLNVDADQGEKLAKHLLSD